MLAIFYCSGKFLKASLVVFLSSRRLNLSVPILAASLTSSSFLSSSSVLMLRVVSLRSVFLLSNAYKMVISSGMGSIVFTWFGFYGSGFMLGIMICGRVMMSGVSFRAAGWCRDVFGIRHSIGLCLAMREDLFRM